MLLLFADDIKHGSGNKYYVFCSSLVISRHLRDYMDSVAHWCDVRFRKCSNDPKISLEIECRSRSDCSIIAAANRLLQWSDCSLIKVYTVCNSVCIFWTHYCMWKWNLAVSTTYLIPPTYWNTNKFTEVNICKVLTEVNICTVNHYLLDAVVCKWLS